MHKWITVAVAIAVVGGAVLWIGGCTRETEQASTLPGGTRAATPAQPTEGTDHTATEPQHAYTYTCPMHPDVKQDRPGKCPDCGMFLEADTEETVEYFCPMDEDVVQDKPGKCPTCGMHLEARPASEE